MELNKKIIYYTHQKDECKENIKNLESEINNLFSKFSLNLGEEREEREEKIKKDLKSSFSILVSQKQEYYKYKRILKNLKNQIDGGKDE